MPSNREFAMAFAIYGAVIGSAVVGTLTGGYGIYSMSQGNNPLRHMPRSADVETGYVDLSELEFIVDDIDRDGTNDLLLSYKGQEYLFVEEQGVPIINEYQLIPSVIVPGEILVK